MFNVALAAAADEGFLDAAQDRHHARVEAALAPLHAGPERSPRSERVRRALRDLDLAWSDPIREEQFGCPCHASYSIGGWELFVADDGTPRCTGGCPPEKVLAALSIPSVEQVRTAAGPAAGDALAELRAKRHGGALAELRAERRQR